MNLNGVLVPLRGNSPGDVSLGGGAETAEDGDTLTVIPASETEPDQSPANATRQVDLVFALDEARTVGYRGLYRCRA